MINIGEALSSYAKVREGAVDGVNCGELLGFDYCSKKKFDDEYAQRYDYEEEDEDEERDDENEVEDKKDNEDGSENQKMTIEKGVRIDMMKSTNFSPLLTELRKLESFSPFAVGGESKLYFSNFQLHVCPVLATSKDFVNLGSVQSLKVESLLEYCEPSPYGDLLENKTKIDPAVRLAMECKAERFQIVDEKTKDNHYKVEFTDKISDAVCSNLLKHLNSESRGKIRLVPNKLNIYSEDGHFKPHTDTPTHDPALFIGSVVVCLPSAHTGGNLIVRHAGKEVNFDFAAQSNNPDFVQFAAFYGDCEHEVLPVTSGHRVTITYSILIEEKGKFSYRYSREKEPTVVTITTAGELRDLDAAPAILSGVHEQLETVLRSSPYIGVFLSHAYTHSGLSAANLKGADKLLYDLLTETMSVPVSLIPVVTRNHSSVYDTEDYEDMREYDLKPTCEVRLLKGFIDSRLPEHKKISCAVTQHVAFLSGWSVKGLEVRNEHKQGGHTGNDVDPTTVDKIYIQGAMIIGPLPGVEELLDA